jgi:hypothetical protein
MRQSYRMARCNHGTKKWVPSSEAYEMHEHASVLKGDPSSLYLVSNSRKSVEHYSSVTTRNIVDTGLCDSDSETEWN